MPLISGKKCSREGVEWKERLGPESKQHNRRDGLKQKQVAGCVRVEECEKAAPSRRCLFVLYCPLFMNCLGFPTANVTTRRRTRLLLQVGVLSILFTGGPFPYVSARGSPAQLQDQERALRTRVEEFYDLSKVGNWSQAENYVTKDSVDTFRNRSKAPFQSYQIDSIKLQPDARNATVLVTLKTMTLYSPTPVPSAHTSHWRLESGLWCIEVRKPESSAMKQFFAPPSPGGVPRRPSSRNPDVEFKERAISVGDICPGEVKIARFPFTNVSKHEVVFTDVQTGCKCLRMITTKKEFKPGESGVLEFEFNPERFDYPYSLSPMITVKTDPGGRVQVLTIVSLVKPETPENPDEVKHPAPQ